MRRLFSKIAGEYAYNITASALVMAATIIVKSSPQLFAGISTSTNLCQQSQFLNPRSNNIYDFLLLDLIL